MSKIKRRPKRDFDISGIRKCSLQSLMNLDKESQNVIGEVFFGRRTVKQRDEWLSRETFNLELDEKELSNVENELKAHNDFLGKKETEFSEAEKELEEKLENLKKAQQEVAEAREKVKRVKDTVEAAQSYHEELEETFRDRQKRVSKRRSLISNFKKIFLIHKSATIKQVSENQYGYIVVTSTDAEYMELIKPDRIVDSEMAIEFVDQLPRDFEKKYYEKERASIIEFCEMVISFTLNAEEGEQIVPVYANKDIDEILRMNGLN